MNHTGQYDAGSELNDGPSRRRRAQGAKTEKLHAKLVDMDPQMADWANNFIFGEVWGRPGMTHDERMIVAITALAARGNTRELKLYLFGAIDAGISARKLRESLTMLVVYVGFPVALGALSVLQEVFDVVRRRGDTLDVDSAIPS